MATQINPRDPSFEDLLARLEEAEATIRAINAGEVDAVVVNGPRGAQVYTLEGADHLYRVLVEQMHEGTVTLDDDRVILYSNGQFAGMIGSPVDNISGSPFDGFLAPYHLSAFDELLEAATIRGHSSGELDLMDAQRHIIPVRVSLTRIDASGLRTMSLVVNDLRERLRNEAIIREEQLSRLMLDQAGEAIVVIDPHGVVVRRSESAKRLAEGPVLLSHFDRVFPLLAASGPVNASKILAASRANDPIRGLEAAMRLPSGVECSVLVSAGPLWNQAKWNQDELLGCVITLTDISQRKAAENVLARQAEELAQANSDLRQFAYSASHDLREPLRQLAVFSELLQKKYEQKLDASAMQLIQHTVQAAHRAEGLLKGLLDYTQATGAPHESRHAIDANQVLRRTLETFEAQIVESGARVDSGSLPELAVHEVHLTQLFQNLIGNALKYRREPAPEIRVAAERAGKMWKIAISDNGIGIATDHRERIFGLFQRLHGGEKYAGSGIGLAICQKIVQRYGGRIWVESELGCGSTFLFTLPGGSRAQPAD